MATSLTLIAIATITIGWQLLTALNQVEVHQRNNGIGAAKSAASTTALLSRLPRGATALASIPGAIPLARAPGGRVVGSLASRYDGARLTIPVVGASNGWIEVRLPGRPNGTTAWVRAADVKLSYTPFRLVVKEQELRLLLERNGRVVDDFPVGIGTPNDPTPTGNYFIALLAEPPSAGYGPFVIVTSAHSKAITDWEDSGDAQIAIHGPLGKDAEIGKAGARISHGCVRLHVADLVQLRDIPVGTPVDIVAS